jgi:hypothetical protein
MAVTTINLSDPVSTLVTKTNTISTGLGDVSTLVTGDANVVAAINTVRSIVNRFDESAEIIALAREGTGIQSPLNIDGTDSHTGFFLTYDSASGTIAFNSNYNFSAGAGLDYDSAGTYNISSLGVTTAMIADLNVTNDKIANSTITSSKFNSVVSLEIQDSTGAVVKTLFSPGS